ncbi:MAG: hypothetical protein ACOYNN_17550 [Terrimicrobiaceae bacterium]
MTSAAGHFDKNAGFFKNLTKMHPLFPAKRLANFTGKIAKPPLSQKFQKFVVDTANFL